MPPKPTTTQRRGLHRKCKKAPRYMDVLPSETPPSLLQHESIDQPPASPISDASLISEASPEFQHLKRHGDIFLREFLTAYPSVVLHLFSAYDLQPEDLARLEVTCKYFRHPANLEPDQHLSITELAAFDMCQKRLVFSSMTVEEKEALKQHCGGSWKLLLKFFLAGEVCNRRYKSQAIAGSGHSIAVSSSGAVYSFGSNSAGQLGLGTLGNMSTPCLIRSLQGIRIVQAAVGHRKTMLVSEAGCVYTFGMSGFSDHGDGDIVTTPQPLESLKNIFVVQAVMGCLFAAVLSREGRVYTFSWGHGEKLGHQTDSDDKEPRPLLGPLENIPVVQIAAGYCNLLALTFQPTGMSVYSVGCGLGGKLGHGSFDSETSPRLIEHLQALNLQPTMIAAGKWHVAALGRDGRVCTWGWGILGCLGHGTDVAVTQPKVVEALSQMKATFIEAGFYTTFVVLEDGDIYSFGSGYSSNMGNVGDEQDNIYADVKTPKLATSLKQIDGRVVHISATKSCYDADSLAHTFVLTDSGNLYSLGCGGNGQLGVALSSPNNISPRPIKVEIDLS